MRLPLLMLLTLTMGSYAHAQDDAKSKSILEKVASTHNKLKTFKVNFKFTSSNIGTKEPARIESGKLLIKDTKYHLTIPNSDIVFDGKSVYNYLKEPNEINITKPEPTKMDKGDFFFSNPRDIFKGYNKNFKSTFIKETNINKYQCYEIDLYPIDLKTNYSRIRMHIDKVTYQLIDIKLFQKDGNQHLLEFSDFVANAPLDDKEFAFDTKKYPNAEVNDMRF